MVSRDSKHSIHMFVFWVGLSSCLLLAALNFKPIKNAIIIYIYTTRVVAGFWLLAGSTGGCR